jgi:type I restriction enzyme R subunit
LARSTKTALAWLTTAPANSAARTRRPAPAAFILDVLRNYTPYKLAFKLATGGKEYDETTVDKSDALRSIMRWVRLHDWNISQKVGVVVEHFRKNIAWRLGGKAKAMVVCASRKEAVRWKLALDKYLREHGYPHGYVRPQPA